MRQSILAAFLLLCALVLAGCMAGDDPGPAGNGEGTPDEEQEESVIQRFWSDRASGKTPANITFTWEVETDDDRATWHLDFGDGSSENGNLDEPEGSTLHTYDEDGLYRATLTVEHGTDQQDQSAMNLFFETPRELPDEWVFEYGPSLGCAGDFAVCVSAEQGPEGEPVDGYWQELDKRYWDLEFLVLVEPGEDSDCTAYDEDLEPITELNGGSGPCDGRLPQGTKWLFMYSYAAPSLSMELEFFEPEEDE